MAGEFHTPCQQERGRGEGIHDVSLGADVRYSASGRSSRRGMTEVGRIQSAEEDHPADERHDLSEVRCFANAHP